VSAFTTRNGLPVDCHDQACICNARTATVTRGAVDAAAEERWFAELDDAMQEYLRVAAEYEAAPKSDRDRLANLVHEAKRDVIDQFSKGVQS